MTPADMNYACGLLVYKNALNDQLLSVVAELQKIIAKMSLGEWEEYKRRTGQR